MISPQRAGPISGGLLGTQDPTDTWNVSKITQSQRVEVERGPSCYLCVLPPSLSPTSKTTTFTAQLWQHIYLFSLLSYKWIQAQVIFLLQNQKGTLEEYKSREKGNMSLNKITCKQKSCTCGLQSEGREVRGVLNSKYLSLCLHMHFSFLGFLSPSVRITVVFLVAKLAQEIKYFVFL